MIKKIKNIGIKLSLITAILATPSLTMAASGSGFMEGSSESISALLETPTFEGQIARINVGINLIRINTDILERMPISADAEWVDKVVAPITTEIYKATLQTEAVQNDSYYSTVSITNNILGRQAIAVSPLSARLFYEASVIYKNSTNGYIGFHIPDMNVFPDITDMKTYVTFKDDDKVEIIDIEAKTGFYRNVVEAVISLLPEDLKENVIDARKEMKEAKNELNNATSEVGQLEAWLDDDKNSDNPQTAEKEIQLKVAQAQEDEKKTIFEEKENSYLALLETGATAIESNYDASKIPLAQKLQKLLDTVDNNAGGAISMFGSATLGLTRGYPTLSDELKAISTAQGYSDLLGNKKEFLVQRASRMAIGALMAVPNISIGTYMAISQSHEIAKYQDIVNKILEGTEESK